MPKSKKWAAASGRVLQWPVQARYRHLIVNILKIMYKIHRARGSSVETRPFALPFAFLSTIINNFEDHNYIHNTF